MSSPMTGSPQGDFDLQVNGYAGVDFNADGLTAEALRGACRRVRADGVGQFLATVISDDLARMARRLRRLAEFHHNDETIRRTMAGIHIEGPFINETDGYRGAHPRRAVRPAEVDPALQLLDAAAGLTRIVTLAPERDPGFKVTQRLIAEGVTVAAGHCNPTSDELAAAADAGLSMFTHLGNGCPMQMHRHDNIIQRALALADRLWLCFIAGGVHVPMPALANYLRCAGLGRSIVVTDATSAAGLGPGRYTLGEWNVQVGEDLVARSPDGSHFVGSCFTMRQVRENLRNNVGLSPEEIERLASINPRRALRQAT